jgi:hypothetical protein
MAEERRTRPPIQGSMRVRHHGSTVRVTASGPVTLTILRLFASTPAFCNATRTDGMAGVGY